MHDTQDSPEGSTHTNINKDPMSGQASDPRGAQQPLQTGSGEALQATGTLDNARSARSSFPSSAMNGNSNGKKQQSIIFGRSFTGMDGSFYIPVY